MFFFKNHFDKKKLCLSGVFTVFATINIYFRETPMRSAFNEHKLILQIFKMLRYKVKKKFFIESI